MARVATSQLGLGMWLDGENPGAGSQVTDNTGLNGNWQKLDTAVGTQHNADGTHKNDVIKGANLIGTGADRVVDNTTLETTATTGAKQIRQKDDGTTGAKLNANVVDNDSLEVSAATGTKVIRIKQLKAGKILGSGTGKAVDGSTINLNGSNELQIPDDGITSAKILHNAVTPEKLSYQEIAFTVSQSSTSSPVGNKIHDNYYGSPVTYTWARTSAGVYTLTASASVFTANKTIVVVGENQHASYGASRTGWIRTSATVLTFYTFRSDTGAAADSIWADCALLIRIYP